MRCLTRIVLLQIFNGDFEESWSEGEKRESKLVFIGKNLDHDGLKKGFKACLATPELLEKQKQSLRFSIGDEVECKTGARWSKGQVVAIMYRDDSMPQGMVAPYQVKLDGGGLIYAPADRKAVIRSPGGATGGEGPAAKKAKLA